VNRVVPEAVDRTRIVFGSYLGDASMLDAGADAAFDRVEAEDETIVEAVSMGVRSPY